MESNRHDFYELRVEENKKSNEALDNMKKIEAKKKKKHILKLGKTIVITHNKERLKEYEEHLTYSHPSSHP